MKSYQFQNKTTGDLITISATSLTEAINIVKIKHYNPNGLGFKLYGIK